MKFYNTGSNNESLDSTARENEAIGILDYGKNNAFPASLLDNIQNSHITKRCIDVINKFIVGDGFEDPSLNDVIINSDGQTLGELHQSLSMDLAYFEGIYTNAKYNQKFETTEYFHLPFENTRLGIYNEIGKITEIKYNNSWGQKWSTDYNEDTVNYKIFNGLEDVVAGQIAQYGASYKGQVLYSHVQRPQMRFYPVPQYYSAENWIKVDSKIGNFHVNNIDNNFLLSVLMKVVGDPTEEVMKLKKDTATGRFIPTSTGKMKGDVFNSEMSNNFSGSSKGGGIMVAWAKAKEQFPELESFPNNTNHDLFISLQNLVTDNLAIATGVPRILANIATAGKLGDTNAITEAVTYMQGNVQTQQSLLEDHYKKLFKNSAIPELKGKTPTIKRFSYDIANNSTGLQE